MIKCSVKTAFPYFFPEGFHHFPFSKVSDADFKIRPCTKAGSLLMRGPTSEPRLDFSSSVSVKVDMTDRPMALRTCWCSCWIKTKSSFDCEQISISFFKISFKNYLPLLWLPWLVNVVPMLNNEGTICSKSKEQRNGGILITINWIKLIINLIITFSSNRKARTIQQ